MRNSSALVLASTNRHKFEEFSELLKNYPEIELVPVHEKIRNADKLGMVENSDQYSENAISKARLANHGCHLPCLADDTGIEVEALSNRPGVRSHRYAVPKLGETQDQANVLKMLQEMQAQANRSARFVCHLALMMEGTLIHVAAGLEGRVASEPRGSLGFGYDSIFIPAGYEQTLAELGPEVKNKISHRALAMSALIEEIKKREIILAKP